MNPSQTAKLASAREKLAQRLAADGEAPGDTLLKSIDKLLPSEDARASKGKKKKAKTSDSYQVDREVIIAKSEHEQLRVTRVIYREMEFINLRVWYCEKSIEAYLPSRKGLTIEIGRRDELIEALKAMTDQCV